MMEQIISSLVESYVNSKEEHYFEELLDMFKPLITSYARKLYYLYNFVRSNTISIISLTNQEFKNEQRKFW